MIVLTAEDAGKVRGRSPADSGRALYPVPLKDGRFILGEEVLDDPANADVRDFLAAMPREPLERLPIYTEADIQPVTDEAASLTERSLDQARDRAAVLEQKAALAEENAGAVLKDDAGGVAVEIDTVKAGIR